MTLPILADQNPAGFPRVTDEILHLGPGPAESVPPLSQKLRTGTRKAHRWVERLAFVRGFLRGLLDLGSYLQLLRDLHAVYGALEAGLRGNAAHPIVGPLVRPELFRQEALAADLDFLHRGPDWRQLPLSPGGLAYTGHLRQLAMHDPALLVAHCYTRYFGDLSGGPILRRMAGLALRLDDRGGLRFYDFPHLPDPAAYKAELRRCLDALPLSPGEQAALVREATRAFSLSGALFSALPAIPQSPASPAAPIRSSTPPPTAARSAHRAT